MKPLLMTLVIVISISCSYSIKNKEQDDLSKKRELMLTLGVYGNKEPTWSNSSIQFRNFQDTTICLPESFSSIELYRISRYIYDVSESMLDVCKMKEHPTGNKKAVELHGEAKEIFQKTLPLSGAIRLYVMEEASFHPSYRSFVLLAMRDDESRSLRPNQLILINVRDNNLQSYVNLSFIDREIHSTERRYTKTNKKVFFSVVYVSGDFDDEEREEFLYTESRSLAVCTAYRFDEEGYIRFIFQ